MCDHNSLTQVMGVAYERLFGDFTSLTGESFELDLSRVRSLLGTGVASQLLSYLKKHEVVLTEYCRTSRLAPHGVKVAADGRPVFLHSLWSALVSECDVCGCDHATSLCSMHSLRTQSYYLLKQTFALFKKAQIVIDPAPSINAFVERMQSPRRRVDNVWLALVNASSKVLARSATDVVPLDLEPFVSTGASYAKTRILDRCETVEDVCSIRHVKNGLDHIPRVQTQPRNRLAVVPKDWSKVRIVFVESSSRMLVQQAARRWLEGVVESGPLSERIRFDDQGYQRQSLRMLGRCSIDLSDASDWLDASVIWRFLSVLPVFRSLCFSSRSQQCDLPTGESLVLSCYSTMGNATTFTVMSVFLACLLEVCESDVHRLTGRKPRRGTVFGDDIVCDDFVAGTMLDYLRLVGLKPSQAKTFISSRFRESCGLDLFEDEDVTPISVKKWNPASLESKAAWLSYSNALHKRGLWGLASFFCSGFDSWKIPVNTTSDDTTLFSFCKGWDSRGARWYHKEQRYLGLRQPKVCNSLSRDNELHLSYALVHSRLKEAVVLKSTATA